ncbi:MAG: TM1812 family CRISPR-associated protein [Lachnospiraceae bacterium]|nr:TM1812 family CRISPR-associated protein [Lachnospiraceae bacterium]
MSQGKSGVLLLFLSSIKSEAENIEYLDERGTKFDGIHTFQAPVQYLIKKAQTDGSPIQRILCITSQQAIKTNALKLLKDEYECKGIEIKAIDYLEEYYSFHDAETQKDFDKVNSIHIFNDLSQDLGANGNNNERVYIDFSSGLRDIIFLMTTLVRFLEFRGIEIGTIVYSMRSGRIVDISYIYEVMRLVNAVNEFLSTGKASELNEFSVKKVSFANDNRFSRIGELIRKIKKFADDISICNISSIDDSIKSIVNEIRELEKQKTDISEDSPDGIPCYKDAEKVFYASMFYSLIPRIKEKLYLDNMVRGKEDQTVINYPLLVRWCTENRLIQQAVTIYTERMPEYYVSVGYIDDQLNDSADISERFYKGFNNGFSDLHSVDEKQLTDRPKSELEWLINYVVPCVRKSIEAGGKWTKFSNRKRKELLGKVPNGKKELCQNALNRIMSIANEYDSGGSPQIYDEPVKRKSFLKFVNSIPSEKSFSHFILYDNKEMYSQQEHIEMSGVYHSKVLEINKIEQEGGDNEIIKIKKDDICEIMRYYVMIKIIRNCLNHAGSHAIDDSLLNAVKELAKKENFVTGFSEESLNHYKDSTDIQNNLTVEGIQSVLNAAIYGECKELGFRLVKE